MSVAKRTCALCLMVLTNDFCDGVFCDGLSEYCVTSDTEERYVNMPLENLLTLIEKLRERIDAHGNALRQSEALTRYALIDPLLRELGWDTEDPALVKPEYGSGRGFADYALFSNNGPIMMLEAKKLDESLVGARRQAVDYAMDETGIKTRYLSVTDGACWEIYDTNKPVSDMLAASFDLKSPSAADACLKVLALWRPSVISGQIAVGETPVIGLPDNRTNTTEPGPAEETTVQSPPPVLDEEGWQPITDFALPTGHSGFQAEILFPDDKQVSIKTGKGIMIEVTRWLIDKNILTKNHCPISFGGNRYLVSTSPKHSNGSSFRNNPAQIGDLHINTDYTRKDLVENTRHIIKHVKQNPAQFKVRLP